jgi:anti-sigma factor RsiW
VKTQRPIASDEEHRVLKFRPRTLAGLPRAASPARLVAEPEPNDLSRYERDRGEPDDFRRRMLANIAAFAFTVALTAVGIWLAVSIADLRKTQDCVLMGRRDCARLAVPHL